MEALKLTGFLKECTIFHPKSSAETHSTVGLWLNYEPAAIMGGFGSWMNAYAS